MGESLKTLVAIALILGTHNYAVAQTVTDNGELPLYHDQPGELEAMISNLFFPYANQGARRNHRRYTGDALDVMTTGIALGNDLMGPCLAPPPGNPIACGMAMAAFNEAGISGESGGESDDQQLRLATDNQRDTNPSALQAQIAAAQSQLASLTTMGYQLSADGQTLTTPPPSSLTLNFADLGSDAALLAAGFTQAQIDQVKTTLDDILTAAKAKAVASANQIAPTANSNNRNNNGGRFFVPNPDALAGGGGASNRPVQGRNDQGVLTGGTGIVRQPTSEVNFDRLSVNFNGTPIGVANGNMFNNVSQIYQNQGLE